MVDFGENYVLQGGCYLFKLIELVY